MRRVFVDTFYWVALLDPGDRFHHAAVAINATLTQTPLVTTEAVLSEVLNHFSGYGDHWRLEAVGVVRDILESEDVYVCPGDSSAFLQGLDFYEARPDKGYSLIDCISMCEMRDLEIFEILTHDAHFRQEGFVTLL